MTDFSFLAAASAIWEEWRFEPWSSGTAEGLYRRVTMIKSGLIGEVARYYADDYIIWKYEEGDPERLLEEVKPESDLFLRRLLFLQQSGQYIMKKRANWLGFRGYIEEHFFTPGDDVPKGIQDVGFLINAALKSIEQKGK